MNKSFLSIVLFFSLIGYNSYVVAIEPQEQPTDSAGQTVLTKEKTVMNALRHAFYQCPVDTMFLGFGLVLTGGRIFSDHPYISLAFGTAFLTQFISYYFPELSSTQDPFIRTLFEAPYATACVLRAIIYDHTIILKSTAMSALVGSYYLLHLIKHYELIELEKETQAEKEKEEQEQLI